MGSTYDGLSPALQTWLQAQRIFFVATAPLAANGNVNCSPKGGDTFRILNEREVAYLDLTGSGIETISHVQENGRIVLMFCAFEGPPKIVRLHGCAMVILPTDATYRRLAPLFPDKLGARAIVRIAVSRIADSCGFSVPLFDHVGPRVALDRWAEKKGENGLAAYRAEKNRRSIDGLPGY